MKLSPGQPIVKTAVQTVSSDTSAWMAMIARTTAIPDNGRCGLASAAKHISRRGRNGDEVYLGFQAHLVRGNFGRGKLI